MNGRGRITSSASRASPNLSARSACSTPWRRFQARSTAKVFPAPAAFSATTTARHRTPRESWTSLCGIYCIIIRAGRKSGSAETAASCGGRRNPRGNLHDGRIVDWQLDNVGFTADPGEIGYYSNLGYTVAARVPEKLSGQSFRNYMRGTVLAECGIGGALGMEIGARARSEQKFSWEAAYYPYTTNDEGPYSIHPGRMDGSTAWIARPSDLLLLARRCDGLGPHRDILSAASITQMRTRSATTTSSTGYGHETYGLGWYTNNYNNPAWWAHNGGMNGTRAEFVVRLDGYSYAWMSNTQQEIPNSDVDEFINSMHAANAWPALDLQLRDTSRLIHAWKRPTSSLSTSNRGCATSSGGRVRGPGRRPHSQRRRSLPRPRSAGGGRTACRSPSCSRAAPCAYAGSVAAPSSACIHWCKPAATWHHGLIRLA